MIKNFLIINCTGKKDTLGLKIGKKFIIHQIKEFHHNSDLLSKIILDFLKINKTIVDNKFSIIVNQGPGRFSSIRTSLSVAKGIKISTGAKIYGYKENQLLNFNLENIEKLIIKKKLENKLIKPMYLS